MPGNATSLFDDFHGAGIGHSSVAVEQPVQAEALEQGFDLAGAWLGDWLRLGEGLPGRLADRVGREELPALRPQGSDLEHQGLLGDASIGDGGAVGLPGQALFDLGVFTATASGATWVVPDGVALDARGGVIETASNLNTPRIEVYTDTGVKGSAGTGRRRQNSSQSG